MAHITNSHSTSIAINGNLQEAVFRQIVLWGEAAWWPKHSLMKFMNLSHEGRVQEGTVYLQKISFPFGPQWHSRVEELHTPVSVTRIFLDGILKGYERVSIVEHGGQRIVVAYYMDATVSWFNYLVWQALFKLLHDYNLRRILRALKEYMETYVTRTL